MTFIVCIGGALVGIGIISVLTASHRRKPPAGHNAIAQVMRARELKEFDAHLESVAREERRRLEENLARYLAGRAGRVVVVSKAPHGIALELSDGRRLALRGISTHNVELLHHRAPLEMLRPESVYRDAISYCLLLRGPAGDELKVYARNLALAD